MISHALVLGASMMPGGKPSVSTMRLSCVQLSTMRAAFKSTKRTNFGSWRTPSSPSPPSPSARWAGSSTRIRALRAMRAAWSNRARFSGRNQRHPPSSLICYRETTYTTSVMPSETTSREKVPPVSRLGNIDVKKPGLWRRRRSTSRRRSGGQAPLYFLIVFLTVSAAPRASVFWSCSLTYS